MSCSRTTRGQRLQDQLTELIALRDVVYATYLKALENPNKKYRLDTGEGSQMTETRSLNELRDQLERLDANIDLLQRRLCGQGLASIAVRRKTGLGRGRGFRP
jgi:hypothetical protein